MSREQTDNRAKVDVYRSRRNRTRERATFRLRVLCGIDNSGTISIRWRCSHIGGAVSPRRDRRDAKSVGAALISYKYPRVYVRDSLAVCSRRRSKLSEISAQSEAHTGWLVGWLAGDGNRRRERGHVHPCAPGRRGWNRDNFGPRAAKHRGRPFA